MHREFKWEIAMPNLHGNPPKSELRQEISNLRTELATVEAERRKLRKQLDWARATVTELDIKIQRMDALAKEAASIAALDIKDRVAERIQAERRAWMNAVADEVFAEAAPSSSEFEVEDPVRA